MKLSMEDSITKILKKFNMSECKGVSAPCITSPLDAGKPSKFPMRELVGALQYVQSMGRPDISFAVQRLSRVVTDVRESAVTAGKRVLAYLKRTADVGIVYSPENEGRFYETYSKVASVGGHSELPNLTAFADADFAGCAATLKSTSGSILYCRGTPVCWKSKKQTIRSLSTCEAEYVGIFDVIQLSKQQGWYDWFEDSRELPLVFTDSMSALALSKNSTITKKSKHMNIRYREVKDHCKVLCFVKSGLDRADPLTKALHNGKYLALFKNDLNFDYESAHPIEETEIDMEIENQIDNFTQHNIGKGLLVCEEKDDMKEWSNFTLEEREQAALSRAFWLTW